MPSLKLEPRGSGSDIDISFGMGQTGVIGACNVTTPVVLIKFYVTEGTYTPFLFCLPDMHAKRVYYDNLTDHLVQCTDGAKRVITNTYPVYRKFGHAFLLLGKSAKERTLVESYLQGQEKRPLPSFLTEQELCRLHHRFGHPSANRLANLLNR